MSDQFLSLPAVQKITGGKSRSTIYRWTKNPDNNFPKPRRIGPNSIGFSRSEIDEWVETTKRQREGEIT